MKKVGKTARPFRYDLNQIPYDYTVEVRNRFKGLDLIDRVPDELWNEVRDIVQETGISRQEYWSGLPFPSPGDLPDPGIEPRSPTLQADALTSAPAGKPRSDR